jgi:hypothetical protein
MEMHGETVKFSNTTRLAKIKITQINLLHTVFLDRTGTCSKLKFKVLKGAKERAILDRPGHEQSKKLKKKFQFYIKEKIQITL